MTSGPVAASAPPDILTVDIVKARPEHRNYLIETYWKTYTDYVDGRKTTAAKRLRSRFMLLWHRARVRVAVDPEDRRVILGWIVEEAPLIHFLYVKKRYRGQGVAHSLVAATDLAKCAEIYATHWTPDAQLHAMKRAWLHNVSLDSAIPLEIDVDEQSTVPAEPTAFYDGK